MQIPDFTQSFNRYSYALNNPLKYVDENGEFFWFIVLGAAIIAGTINVATHAKEIKAAGGGWKGFLKGAGYFAVGGIAGGAGAAVGVVAAVGAGAAFGVTAAGMAAATTGASSGALVGAASGATSGFLMELGNSAIGGDKFGTAIGKAFMGGLTGGLIGGAVGAVSGGFEAWRQGKDIWTGQDVYKLYYGYEGEVPNMENVRYVGITKRNPQIRFHEHWNSGTNRSTLNFSVVKKTNGLMNARIMEQLEINRFGLQKNGGQLFNLRNEISPKYWGKFGIKM